MTDQKPNNILHLEEKLESLSREVSALNSKVSAQTASIEGLLSARQASRATLSFIKWLASIASGLAVIWAAIHSGPPGG